MYYFFMNANFGFQMSSLKLIIRPHGQGPWVCSLSRKMELIYSKMISRPASAQMKRMMHRKQKVWLFGKRSSLMIAFKKHRRVSSFSLYTICLKVSLDSRCFSIPGCCWQAWSAMKSTTALITFEFILRLPFTISSLCSILWHISVMSLGFLVLVQLSRSSRRFISDRQFSQFDRIFGFYLISLRRSILRSLRNGSGCWMFAGQADRIKFLSCMQWSGKLLIKLKWKSLRKSGKSYLMTQTTLKVAW